MFSKLNGFKTYAVIVIGVVALVSVNVLGITIPGLAPSPDWMNQVGVLVMGAGLRAGIKNDTSK